MFGINPWVILAVVAAFIANGFYWHANGHTSGIAEADAKWTAKYIALEAEKNRVKDEAVRDYIEREAANLKKTQDLEAKANAREKYIRDLQLSNGRLVDATCGMFDRSGRPTGSGGADGPPLATGPALSAQGRPTICGLPDAVREAVQRFGRGIGQLLLDADLAASYAISGHDFAVEIEAFRTKVMELNREAVPR